MFKVRKRNEKYKDIIELCVLSQNFQVDKDFIERLSKGEYVLEVEKCRRKDTQFEEEMAREDVEDFLRYSAVMAYQFEENLNESYYDLTRRYVKVGSRVKKFETLMPNSTLESIIMLEYTRACGYRGFYKGDGYKNHYGYEQYCNDIVQAYEKSTQIKLKKGEQQIQTKVSIDTFKKLVKMEYLAEVSAWRYVISVLEAGDYKILENGKCRYSFVKEEVFKMGEYYLQKRIEDLHLVMEKGELMVSNKYLFRCR